MSNSEIAKKLLDYARAIAASHLFRARAYRRAAFVIQGQDRAVAEMDGRELAALPGIGKHLAYTIETLISTGEFVPYSERKQRRMRAA